MPNLPTTPGVRIPALRKHKAEHVDLMAPGAGTPWEDRGTAGLVRGFFVTCTETLRRPRLMFNSIRRPEMVSDANSFAIGCGMLWAAAVVVHALIHFASLALNTNLETDWMLFWTQYAMLILAAPAATVLLLRLGARVFGKLVAGEIRDKVPESLLVNIFAYCLAPSLLAPIPFLGPWIACAWIFALVLVAARSRLHLASNSAIVCSVLSYGAVLLITVAVLFGGRIVWKRTAGDVSFEKPKPKPVRIIQR